MNLIIKNIVVLAGKILFSLKSKTIPKDPKKILIIRSGGIGDVLMSTPLVKAIRHNYPKSEITYFVGNWSKDALKDNPNINKLYTYDDLIIIRMNISGIRKIIKEMKKEHFDLCFNLEKSWHWGILSYLFKIPTRIGFNRKGEGFAYNLSTPFKGKKYELEYYLDLARLLNLNIPTNKMEVCLTKQELIKAKKYLKGAIGLAPGGADNPAQQASIKRWPLENYKQLIQNLPKQKFILFGGKNDLETCNQLQTRNTINLAGKLTLKESAAVMKQCKVIITHDAGPMHLAAASKSHLIALFGPTQALRFAPRDAITLQTQSKPCYTIYGTFERKDNYMGEIPVEKVLKIIKAFK